MPIGLAALAGASALAGGAQAVGSLVPSKFDKKNKEEIARLEALKQRGALGMSPEERAVMEQSQMNPIRSAAEALQSRGEAFQAATGQASGAQAVQQRRDTASVVGEGIQQAALATQQENIRARRAQEAELSQRQAAQEQRRTDKVKGFLGGLGQAAGAAGMMAGAVPEATRATGLFGARLKSPEALQAQMDQWGLEPQVQDYFNSIGPEQARKVFVEALSGGGGQDAAALRQLILQRELSPGRAFDVPDLAGVQA